MKLGRKRKTGYVLALAAVLLLPCISLLQTHAANEVDKNKACSLTVSVEIGSASGSNDAYLEDFNQMSIPVSIYRVADVDITGQHFTPEDAFARLDLRVIDRKGSSLTAEDWQKLAQQADRIRTEASLLADHSTTVKKQEGGSQAAYGVISGLLPGMYLVVPEASYNPDYTVLYEFSPYLTALPGSSYTSEGTGSDEWVYDTAIGLKPDARPQFGALHIRKTLENYNETLGKTTFVFRIIGKDKDGVIQYEEVESMTFSAAGSDTVTLEHIPAGLTLTVTEVYSGASYTVVGSKEATTVVWSDAAVEAGAGSAAEVSFTNRYDGGNRGGYGVTNRFQSDGSGGWIWENPTAEGE